MAVKEQMKLLQEEIRQMKVSKKRSVVEQEQQMKLHYNTMMRLVHMGLLKLEDIDGYSIRWGITRRINREDLPRARKAVGKLFVYHKELHIENNKVSEDKILVTVAVANCSGIKLQYVKDLPLWAKCQIKKVVIPPTPQREEFALVCPKE